MAMILKINPDSTKPVFRQIIDQVIAKIDRNTLKAGDSVPSSRSLAVQLGVNRTTVYRAYAELQALGYLSSRPGSYNTVQKRKKEALPDTQKKSRIPWDSISSSASDLLYREYKQSTTESAGPDAGPGNAINMARLQVDPRLYPLDDFRRCVNRVLTVSGHDALNYGDHQGFPPLREIIARRLRMHGIAVAPEEILITNGAQQAIDLICRVMDPSRRGIAVEAPTYSGVIPLFRFNGFELINIPMKPYGMDLHALENHLRKGTVRFVYTMPNFHNPMGVTTAHPHREKLLQLCDHFQVPIVEDGFEEEMKYYGKVPLPIKSIDANKTVIYIGTFSKALFAGLRIGWIAADRAFIGRLLSVKRYTDLSGSHLTQRVMHEFCAKGYYEKQLKRLHRAFRKRMDLALKIMEEKFPGHVSWTKPLGGYTIWVRMPRKISLDEFDRFMSEHGVFVTPGKYFFPDQQMSEHYRICIASLNEHEIGLGLERLSRAMNQLGRTRKTT